MTSSRLCYSPTGWGGTKREEGSCTLVGCPGLYRLRLRRRTVLLRGSVRPSQRWVPRPLDSEGDSLAGP